MVFAIHLHEVSHGCPCVPSIPNFEDLIICTYGYFLDFPRPPRNTIQYRPHQGWVLLRCFFDIFMSLLSASNSLFNVNAWKTLWCGQKWRISFWCLGQEWSSKAGHWLNVCSGTWWDVNAKRRFKNSEANGIISFFLRLSNIPLCICTYSLSIHLSMDS